MKVDTVCAEQVGMDLHIDWESFGEEPHAVTGPGSVADVVVLGAMMLLAGDFGDLAATRARFERPAWFFAETQSLSAYVAPAFEEDLGAYWYTLVTSRVELTIYDPELAYRYQFDDGTLRVNDPPSAESIERGNNGWDMVNVAGTLVHEASHATQTPHVACENPDLAGCDADPESGVNGTEALFHRSWMQGFSSAPEEDRIVCYGSWLDEVCRYITNTDDFAACDDVDGSIACYL